MKRLAALVPPPRFNIVRFFGVLAPSAGIRSLIVPKDESAFAPAHSGCRECADTIKMDSDKNDSQPVQREREGGMLSPADAFNGHNGQGPYLHFPLLSKA